MELGATSRNFRYWQVVAIGLTALAVISPLYIDRRSASEDEEDEQPINLTSWLPVLLCLLIIAIGLSAFLDRSFTSFDPYWIHRVGGSSGGIIVILIVLFLVLKCKASVMSWDA